MGLPLNPHFDADVELYPFQVFGAFWLSKQTNAILGDEMGLGKTIQAIHAIDIEGLKTGVVVAPVSAVYNWKREFEKFSWYGRRIAVMRQSWRPVPKDADIVIVSPGLLRNPVLARRINKRRWDFLIVDEAHEFRNGERIAKQTVGLYGKGCKGEAPAVIAACDRRWLLTGTPIPNHVGELWTHCRALWPEAIKSGSGRPMAYSTFLRRYAVTRQTQFGIQAMRNNPHTIMELKAKVIAPHMLRRTKAQAKLDLPPLHMHKVALAVDDMAAQIEALAEEIPDEVLDVLANLDVDDPNADQVLRKLKTAEPSIARLRRITGLLKVAPSSEMISSSLLADPTRKAIVFAYHRDVITRLEEAFAANGLETVTITGGVTGKKRQDVIDAFQQKGGPRVFIGQLTACNTAITLTRACDVYLIESAWTPSVNGQAIARAWRIGQHRPVTARFLTLEGSVDDVVVEVLLRKTRAIRELLR